MPTDSFPLFGEMRWTSAELAAALLLTPQRVTQLSKENVLPQAVDGLYTPVESVANYIRYIRQREAGKSKAGEEVRKLQLENELRAIRLKKIAGALVPVSQVEKDFFEVARRTRDAFLNLPSRLSGPFSAEKNQEKIFQVFTEEIRLVLNELSRAPIPTPGPPSEPVPPLPAKVSDSQDEAFDRAFLDQAADDPDDKFPTGD